MTPTPEAIADALEAAVLGADLGRLSQVCRHQADQHEGIGRERLLAAAESLAWGAKVLEAMEASPTAKVMPDTSGTA